MVEIAKQPLNRLYVWTIALLMFVLPLVSIAIEAISREEVGAWIPLIGKWFIFWAVGMRLLTAGLRQIITPAFTAVSVFHLEGKESHVVIRELGFANLCMSLVAVISLFAPEWRMAGAFVGGLYMGLAGFLHVFKRPEGPNEAVALVSDLWIFAIMLVYLLETAL